MSTKYFDAIGCDIDIKCVHLLIDYYAFNHFHYRHMLYWVQLLEIKIPNLLLQMFSYSTWQNSSITLINLLQMLTMQYNSDTDTCRHTLPDLKIMTISEIIQIGFIKFQHVLFSSLFLHRSCGLCKEKKYIEKLKN